MKRWTKLLIGAAAALAAGWISHGPLGRGEAFVAGLEAAANAQIAEAELPGVAARFSRDPLSRRAILTGTANDFQREGMGQLPGLNDRIRGIAGISGIEWQEDSE